MVRKWYKSVSRICRRTYGKCLYPKFVPNVGGSNLLTQKLAEVFLSEMDYLIATSSKSNSVITQIVLSIEAEWNRVCGILGITDTGAFGRVFKENRPKMYAYMKGIEGAL